MSPGCEDLDRLVAALEVLSLPDRPEAEAFRRRALEAAAALRHRRRRLGGERLPTIRFLCGPSGGGKSSLFNALVGERLSFTSSVERPATRGVIAALGGGAGEQGLMPSLDRCSTREHPGGSAFRLAPIEVAGLDFQVLVDCPDYDSREDRNRALVDLVLPWADEVVMVTSQERYGDRSAGGLVARLRRLGIPLVAIINKVEGDLDAALAEFRDRLLELGAPEPRLGAALARHETGLAGDTPVVGELRRAAAPLGDDERPFIAEIVTGLRDGLLPEIETWRGEVAALREDLDGLLALDDDLRDDGRMRRLAEYEEESKFWLRYSPRGLARGLRELLRNPGRLFRSSELPSEPEENTLLELVMEQATGVAEGMDLRAREVLKRHRPGRLLIARGLPTATEDDAEALARKMRPIAQTLHEFGRQRIETFRREWARQKQGFLARARFWAVDKVLRLLGLCLTLAVLPPLIWELLRFIGHPAFTNEVTAEFHRARAAFRDGMAEVEQERIRSIMAAVDGLGPSSAQLAGVRAALGGIEKGATSR
ncbi:MAG: hypothetical protein H6807_03680 [Planctomycetes bacterium]|nr:hypothetical protein [Planctomycetota bacterium]